MKYCNILPGIILTMLLIAGTGCKKDPVSPVPVWTYPDIPPTAFIIGDNKLVEVINETSLTADYKEGSSKVTGFSWVKISGPDRYTLENKNFLNTKLSDLEKGVYFFELTVTDVKGLYGKDTLKVTVGEMSATPKEMFFDNISWGREVENGTLLWGSIFTIPGFYNYLPVGTIFRVYIQNNNSSNWLEVAPYERATNEAITFSVYNDKLQVYSNFDETGAVKLKIIY